MSKRARQEDDGDLVDEGGEKNKQKTTQGAAKKETLVAKMRRLQALGQAYSDEHEVGFDTDNVDQKSQRALWEDTIAAYIVREAPFLKMMRYPPDMDTVRVSKVWLINIHLPGRYKLYKSFEKWMQHCWDDDTERRVLSKATEMLYNAVPVQDSAVISRVHNQPPADDDETKALRLDIFGLQTARLRIINAVHEASDQEYSLMRRLISMPVAEDEKDEAYLTQETVDELEALGRVKAELRGKLHDSPTNKTGQKVLERLLTGCAHDPAHSYFLQEQVVNSAIQQVDTDTDTLLPSFEHSKDAAVNRTEGSEQGDDDETNVEQVAKAK